jgi:hypothetical protein
VVNFESAVDERDLLFERHAREHLLDARFECPLGV